MDADSQIRADLDELSSAIDAWAAGLNELKQTLLQLRDEQGPSGFERWALVTAGLDRETLDDFLSFDGSLERVTDRMIGAFTRVVRALN